MAADGHEDDNSPPEITRETPFHALVAHGKCRAFRAEFDIMHKSSAIRARISTVVVVVRASPMLAAHECIFSALRYVMRRCLTIYFVFSRHFLF